MIERFTENLSQLLLACSFNLPAGKAGPLAFTCLPARQGFWLLASSFKLLAVSPKVKHSQGELAASSQQQAARITIFNSLNATLC